MYLASGLQQAVVSFVRSHWPVFACLWLLYTAAVALYRLTWHPLAAFPGPKLAGASYCYEFWFDVVLGGRYTREIARLHESYGPLIRISPDELHCNDADFVDAVYPHGRERRHKSRHYLAAIPWGLRLSGVGTADHDQHRVRRAALCKYFSRAQILQNEGLVHKNVQHLCDKLLGHRGRGPFELMAAYSCFTADVLMSYCFGHSLGNLDEPGWQPAFKGTIDNITGVFYLSRHLPQLAWLAEWIPVSLVQALSSQIGSLLELIRVTTPLLVKRAKAATDGGCLGKTRPTVIQALLQSDLPSGEKTLQRLTSEANAVVLGGTHTISAALTVLTYHLLANPKQLARVRAELQAVAPDATMLPPWPILEKLPYLSAVILEGLRLMYGIASRISVVSPDQELLFQASWRPPNAAEPVDVRHAIPRGYAVGMSSYIMHSDPRLFPNASQFVPDRWLDEHGQRNRGLERYLLSFARGSRQCLGMQLAYCELYVATAALALRVMPRMSLHQTTVDDVGYDHDQLIAMPKRGSNGVRIAVH